MIYAMTERTKYVVAGASDSEKIKISLLMTILAFAPYQDFHA